MQSASVAEEAVEVQQVLVAAEVQEHFLLAGLTLLILALSVLAELGYLQPTVMQVVQQFTEWSSLVAVQVVVLAHPEVIERLIGEEARKDRTSKVIAQLPVDVATYLMNEKRDWLNDIEQRGRVEVILVPNKYLETPAYELRRSNGGWQRVPLE